MPEQFKCSYKHQIWHICPPWGTFSEKHVSHAKKSIWRPFFKMAASSAMNLCFPQYVLIKVTSFSQNFGFCSVIGHVWINGCLQHQIFQMAAIFQDGCQFSTIFHFLLQRLIKCAKFCQIYHLIDYLATNTICKVDFIKKTRWWTFFKMAAIA